MTGWEDVRVRPATADDMVTVASLQMTAFADRWTVDAIRRLAGLAGAIVLLAERAPDAVPVGYLIGQVITDEAEIHSLAVAEAARRRGIGRLLLAAFEGLAVGQGAVSAVLEVAEDDPAAKRLYDAAGYTIDRASTRLLPDRAGRAGRR